MRDGTDDTEDRRPAEGADGVAVGPEHEEPLYDPEYDGALYDPGPLEPEAPRLENVVFVLLGVALTLVILFGGI